MGRVTDLNITGKDESAFAADMGMAHEFLVTAILIRLGFEVGVMQVSRTPYDLWLLAYDRPDGNSVSLRVQIKTVSKGGTIKLTGGTRGGIDREYKSDVKEYKYSTEHSDLLIGVDRNTFDLYLVPTSFLDDWGKSKAVSLLKPLKNNWDLLMNWNDEFIISLRNDLIQS
ncbi:MAG: hypothetical protein EAX81_03920 [Candidatus Thorarchaeota archaeon]|nr:hypothetical protein [Candidatus Thorarchaeota archaeon]